MFQQPIVTAYLMLTLVGVAGAVGDILICRWARTSGWGWLCSSWVLWILSVTLFGYFLRSDRFAFSTSIFIAFAAHGFVSLLFELAVLRTRLSWEEWLGMVLAMTAVVVLEVGRSRREAADAPVAASMTQVANLVSEVQE